MTRLTTSPWRRRLLSVTPTALTADCRYDVSWSGDNSIWPNRIELVADTTRIPQTTPQCDDPDGWFWEDDAHTRIRLCTTACKIQSENETDIDIQLWCATDVAPVVE